MMNKPYEFICVWREAFELYQGLLCEMDMFIAEYHIKYLISILSK